MNLLLRQRDPAGERLVVLELAQDDLVNAGDVGRITRQDGPAEWAAPGAEQRPDEGGDESGEVEGVLHTPGHRLGSDVVAVVEDDHPALLEVQHGLDVDGHGVHGSIDVLFGMLRPEFACLIQRQPDGDVAVQRVVGRGLVGHSDRLFGWEVLGHGNSLLLNRRFRRVRRFHGKDLRGESAESACLCPDPERGRQAYSVVSLGSFISVQKKYTLQI